MKITRPDLESAALEADLTPAQIDRLWHSLSARQSGQAGFGAAQIAYYFGALVIIAAMTWLMTKAWETAGGLALSGFATLYAALFIVVGRSLRHEARLRIPTGLLFTIAVCMAPLAIYGVERATGLWPQGDPGTYSDYYIWIRGSWLTMELGTIAAGLIALRCWRFAFLTAPIAVALWFLSMDLTPLLFGRDDFNWHERAWVSTWFGLVILLVAWFVDRRGRDDDFSFWLYLFGLLAFWGGLSSLDSDSEVGKAVYALINVFLVALAILLRRVAFLVFGALGLAGYLGHLAWRVFADSFFFPFALTAIGLAVMALGVVFQRRQEKISTDVQQRLPAWLLTLIPPRARHRS